MKKNSGFALSVWLGMTLSALGCGAAPGTDGADTLGNTTQELVNQEDQAEAGDMHQTAVPMTLAQFQSLGSMSDQAGRCVGGISYNECKGELDWGLSQNLITTDTYYWGLNNGYYPVIDRHNNIGAVCKCGCFEANSLILTQDKQGISAWVPAKEIKSGATLFALNEEATLSRPSFNAKSIKVSTKGEETPALFVFELDNGHSLKVTQNHGMLLSDGRVVEARTLSAGAEFVALDGSIVRVNNLRFEYTTEDVHNFEVDAQDLAGHIIAAEGVLVGDLAWQNQLSRELGSIAVRR